jgi:hypothetical protein
MEATGPPPVQQPAARRLWRVALTVPVALAGALAVASWWLTEPLTDHPTQARTAEPAVLPVPLTPAEAAQPGVPPPWPDGRLDGEPAKKILLATLIAAGERLDDVAGYTATFKK